MPKRKLPDPENTPRMMRLTDDEWETLLRAARQEVHSTASRSDGLKWLIKDYKRRESGAYDGR